MRTLSLWMQMSLDGHAVAPNRAFDWPVMGQDMQEYSLAELRDADAFVYGRRVYEGMAAFWPTADLNPPTPFHAEYARIWKPMPKYVVSKTLEQADWNATVIGDDVKEQIEQLKREEGKGLVFFGGAETAAELVRLGLIDEYRIFLQPVVLGGGTPPFPTDGERRRLTLLESRAFEKGVVYLRYAPA